MPAITHDCKDNNTLEPKVSYPDNQWEEEAAEVLLRRSQRLMQTANVISCPPAGISQAALNAFTGNLYMQELQQSMANNATPSGLEEVASGVVHPVTKETITKYKKLINDPLLRDDWMKGMCKELGRLAQGYGEKGADDYVKGTNTVLFMDLDKIKTIPKDQVVPYARIVVDYCPQKQRFKSCENNSWRKPNQLSL